MSHLTLHFLRRNALAFGDKGAIRGVLQKKKEELGPVTFHQMAVLTLFIILVQSQKKQTLSG